MNEDIQNVSLWKQHPALTIALIWAFLGLRSVRSVCVLFVGLGVEFNESAVVCLSQPLWTNVLLVLGNGFTNYL